MWMETAHTLTLTSLIHQMIYLKHKHFINIVKHYKTINQGLRNSITNMKIRSHTSPMMKSNKHDELIRWV